MKIKGLVFVSCIAAVGLIASPAFSAPQKKSVAKSQMRPHPTKQRTTQVTPTHNRGAGSSHIGNTRYTGTRQFTRTSQNAAVRRYAGRSYAGTRYYGNSGYAYGRPSYYYGNSTGFGYPYYNSYSYSPGGYYGYYPYSYYGGYANGYPYSYHGGYANTYSYYQPAYGYDSGTVAAVQQRLGEFGFYDGAVDGVMGPRTRAAIIAYESRHGMVVDGTISPQLLGRMGLG